jgi:hypothetical protein
VLQQTKLVLKLKRHMKLKLIPMHMMMRLSLSWLALRLVLQQTKLVLRLKQLMKLKLIPMHMMMRLSLSWLALRLQPM